MTRHALVLAGHGSQLSPHTAGLVWSYVDQLRAWGVADEITACFWKEQPGFDRVIDSLAAEHITVVPLFTARGYFSTQVIPAEMGLRPGKNNLAKRTVYYTPTLGEDPGIGDLVQQLVMAALSDYQLDPQQTAVAIIGHGTRRNRSSQDTARQQAERLQAQNMVAEVLCAYLDDDPAIDTIYSRSTAPNIIALPFFLAPGSHVTQDLPEALGIDPEHKPAYVHGRAVYYADPIGADLRLPHMILGLARSSGQKFAVRRHSATWSGFPQVGSSELIREVEQQGYMRFGQLELTPSVVQPATNTEPVRVLQTAQALRQILREAPFRPLSTRADLPTGWIVPLERSEMLPAVVETVYPGAVADWAQHQWDQFEPESLHQFAQRQTGMFRDIHVLPASIINGQVRAVCGSCVRHATWHFGESPRGAIPCKSPCNYWLSQALEVVA